MATRFFLASILLALTAIQSAHATDASGYDVILIAGQSNAVGFGCGPATDVSTANDSNIHEVMPDGSISYAREPLSHAPMDGGKAGKGFGMTFARLYAAKLPSNRRVLLVPVALGGTSIMQWDNRIEDLDFKTPTNGADPIPDDTTQLYDTLVRQTRHALASNFAGSDNRIVALLWHQGETDMLFMNNKKDPINKTMNSVATYDSRLRKLIGLIRATFPEQGHFPVIVGELGRFFETSFPGPNGLTAFNAGLASLAKTTTKMAVVPSVGLTNGASIKCSIFPIPSLPDGDPVHFNAQSQVEFGKRYFAAFSKLTAKKSR